MPQATRPALIALTKPTATHSGVGPSVSKSPSGRQAKKTAAVAQLSAPTATESAARRCTATVNTPTRQAPPAEVETAPASPVRMPTSSGKRRRSQTATRHTRPTAASIHAVELSMSAASPAKNSRPSNAASIRARRSTTQSRKLRSTCRQGSLQALGSWGSSSSPGTRVAAITPA